MENKGYILTLHLLLDFRIGHIAKSCNIKINLKLFTVWIDFFIDFDWFFPNFDLVNILYFFVFLWPVGNRTELFAESNWSYIVSCTTWCLSFFPATDWCHWLRSIDRPHHIFRSRQFRCYCDRCQSVSLSFEWTKEFPSWSSKSSWPPLRKDKSR